MGRPKNVTSKGGGGGEENKSQRLITDFQEAATGGNGEEGGGGGEDVRPRDNSQDRDKDTTGSGKRPASSPIDNRNAKETRLDTDSLKNKVLNTVREVDSFKNSKPNIEMVTVLLTAIATLGGAVLEICDSLDNLKSDNEKDRISYADILKDTTSLKTESIKSAFAKELELADRTQKIMDIGLKCSANESGDLANRIRSELGKNTLINNEILDAKIVPIFPKGKPNPNNKEEAVPVGCIIQCKSLEKKKALSNTIRNEYSTWNTPYHFPSKLVNTIRTIRKDFEDLKNTNFDPKNSQLLIRPNNVYSGLMLKYRINPGDSWTKVGFVGIDDLIGFEEKDKCKNNTHNKLFKNLTVNSNQNE